MKAAAYLAVLSMVIVAVGKNFFPASAFRNEAIKDAPVSQGLIEENSQPRRILEQIKEESSGKKATPPVQGREIEEEDPYSIKSFLKDLKKRGKINDSEFENAMEGNLILLPPSVLMEIGTTPSLARAAISPDQIFSEEDVLTEKELSHPRTSPLYRGDKRPFRVIFAKGFRPRAPARMSLQEHISYVEYEDETQWISTTDKFPVAVQFAYDQGHLGYVYEIYKPGGIPVRSILKAHYQSDEHILNRLIDYVTIWEFSFSRPIEPRFIKGAWEFKGKSPGKFFPNPNFRPN